MWVLLSGLFGTFSDGGGGGGAQFFCIRVLL
jgi:hypothetical protein